MIRTERQYSVTRAERDALASRLAALPVLTEHGAGDWTHLALQNSLVAQLSDLDAELRDYEALRDGSTASLAPITSLANLPQALIRARIARRLTQRELAERLGLREQQVQRYEAGDYAGASIARLQEVADALGLTFTAEIGLSGALGGATQLRQRLLDLGLDAAVTSRRFLTGLPAHGGDGGAPTLDAVARAARVFGVTASDLLSGEASLATSRAAFRAGSTANRERLSAYAVYAEYLAGLLAKTCTVPFTGIPDAAQVRELIRADRPVEPLPALLRLCWERGVPVLPLTDRAAFHGACWHLADRPVIALKQPHRSPDRWSFVLAHELHHAGNPEEGTVVLEEDSNVKAWRERPAEQAADRYAAEVFLGARAEALARVAVEEASHDASRLKAVVPAVAEAAGVSPGVLADYLAYRLTASGINWWPTANTLHPQGSDAWRTARHVLFDYADLSRLDPLDRDILVDGLTA